VLTQEDIAPEPPPRRAENTPARDPGASERPDRERQVAWWILLAIGAAYLVTQLLRFPSDRPSNWDEAVYVSQVTPGMEALFMAAWRSRGITLLVAPVTLLGGSLSDVRLYLTIVSAAALTSTFGLWIPLIGFAAPIAAFLFSFTWLALINGSAVMPNFWAAILGVAVAGLVARRLEGGSLTHAVLAAAMLGAMALIRPTEATVMAGVIGLYLLVFTRESWRFGLALGVGFALGWLPWVLEMSIRFGGPLNALRQARSAGHIAIAPVGENVLAHLGFTYGRAKLPPDGLPVAGIVWWSLLVVLSLIALRRSVGSPARSAALLSFLATAAFALEYLVLVPIVAARFLLPAYAFAGLTAAIGVVSLIRSGIAARIVGAALLLLIVPWAIWQGEVGTRVLANQLRPAEKLFAAGVALKELANGRPCSFVSPANFPQVQIASGCNGGQLTSPTPTAAQLDAVAAGQEVFIILLRPAKARSPLADLEPTRLRAVRRPWFVYQLSELRR
jgi:hypothetical protein